MKILIVQDHLRSGGTERQSVLLANAFAAAGHATTLVTFRPSGALAATVEVAVARHTLQPFDLHLDWLAPGLYRYATHLAPDVILCMGRMANCYAGGLQQHLPRTAVIATMRTGKPLPRRYRRSLHLARHVVANSTDAARGLTATYAVPPEKITVIHNSLVFPFDSADSTDSDPSEVREVSISDDGAATPPAHSESSCDRLRAHHAAKPNTLVLLCVGMFRPEKGQRELIEIAGMIRPGLDWQLWLAGDGKELGSCRRLAATLGLQERVKFLGLVDHPGPLYRAANLGVLASRSESLSNFLIEAQAHGLPVLAYDVQGVHETMLSGTTGWIVPYGEKQAFTTWLEDALTGFPDLHELRELAPQCRAFARAAFSPAGQTQRYLDLFARLLP